MIQLFSSYDPWLILSLVLALGFVLAFEFINGFHDTANAVATVIYTRAMPPYLAVIASGIFNFLGVLLGGVGVAYAIVHLLPVELLIDTDTGRGLAMVFSLLTAAIAWNLGTWYLGIPASSSHTLIGSILGVGLANAMITDIGVAEGVNWQKAIDIGLSLIASPMAGFAVAGLILLLLKWKKPHSSMHRTPEFRMGEVGKKHPPFWARLVLVLSAMGVSFVHGSNDGQKGIGLIMLVLIGIVPAHFVLNLNSSAYDISRTRDAAMHLSEFYQRNAGSLSDYLALGKSNGGDLPTKFRCDPTQTEITIAALQRNLDGVTRYEDMPEQAGGRPPLPAVPGRHCAQGLQARLPARGREGGPQPPAQGPDLLHRIRALLGGGGGGAGPGHRHHDRLEAGGADRGREDRQGRHDLRAGHERAGHRGGGHRHGQRVLAAGVDHPRAVVRGGRHHGCQPQRPAEPDGEQHPARLGADAADLDGPCCRPVLAGVAHLHRLTA
ncbi:Phosphate/sulfate permease [Azoarcus olearius]|nr:inorganic phosphate transporter [Azoarcus olearius]ANQ85828.1 Phosphate/sulfate permease [Azoarcus olearius]